nr:SpoIIE family protein phosphatase [Calditrichia bacterium]
EITQFLDITFGRENYVLFLNRDNHLEPVNETLNNPDAHPAVSLALEASAEQYAGNLSGFFPLNTPWQGYQSLREQIRPFMMANAAHFFVPLVTPARLMGFILFSRDLEHFLNVPETQDFLSELFHKTAQSLDSTRIHSEIRRKSLESGLLLETVKGISGTLNLDTVLEKILENLGRLVPSDAVAIFLVDEKEGLLQHSISRGYQLDKEGLLSLKLNQGISGEVIRSREGVITPDVAKVPNYYPGRPQTRSQLTVPIISEDTAIGAFTLESDQLNHFNSSDLELLTIFSGLAAIALRNAQLFEDSLRKQRLESDLVVASKIQKALLPRRVPAIEGLQIEVLNIASMYIGGDLYDVFRIGDKRQGIAIGDGSGKGSPGAILMAVAYAGFKSLFKEIDPVNTIVARLNNLLAEVTTPGYYVTFFFGILDLEAYEFTYCNAGHNPTILLHEDGSHELLMEGGTVVGFLPNQSYSRNTVAIAPGDYLVLYTDGVTEIQNFNEEEFGEERLLEVLRANMGRTPREMRFAVIEAIRKFSERQEFQDDVTMLVVQVK